MPLSLICHVMPDPDLLHRLAVALAIGLLVGVERHWHERDAPAGSRTAGVRTYALSGLMGGVLGAVAAALPGAGALLLGLGFLGYAGVFAAFALREAAQANSVSATGAIAGQLTFALGALAVLAEPALAGAGAVATVAVLAARETLHGLVSRVTWVELRSAVLWLSMTLVVLPLLPKGPIAALGGLDPARVWTLAIVLAGVGFAGWVAVRLLGPTAARLVAGAAAGLVSSTAATLANARAATSGEAAAPLAAGALAAGASSWLRTLVLAVLVAPPLLPSLLAPVLAGAVPQAAAALWLARGAAPPNAGPPEGKNPFELLAVLQMALLLALVGVAAEAAAEHFGGQAVLLVAAVSGLADVDAVTLSVGALVPGRLAPELAAAAIGVALGANTVAKAVYAIALGTTGFAWRFGAASLAGLVAGGAGLLLR